MEVRRIGPDGGFLREFTDVRKRVQHLETRPSGVIATRDMFIVTDPETGVKTIMGKLPDGSTGFQPFIGDIVPPPVATAPTATAQPGTITVTWDGTFVGAAEQPADFEHLNVMAHKIVTGSTVLTLEVGSIRLANESVVITSDIISYGETWQFSFESEDYNGNISARSVRTPLIAVVSYVDDSQVGEALADLSAATQTAQQAAQTAQGAANAAQLDADAAAQSALDAATLAGSKGVVYTQATAPTGDYSGLWYDTAHNNVPRRYLGIRNALFISGGGGSSAVTRLSAKGWAVSSIASVPSFEEAVKYDFVAMDAGYAGLGTEHANLATKLYNRGVSLYTSGNDTTSLPPLFTGAVSRGTPKNVIKATSNVLGITYPDYVDTDLNFYLTGVNSAAVVTGTTFVTSLGTDQPLNLVMEHPTNFSRWVHIETYNSPAAVIDLHLDWISDNWVAIQDQTVLADIIAANALAAGKTKTYYQTGQPSTTGNSVGDMWVDIDDSYKLYTWSGSAWQVTQDAQAALNLANTKIRSFVQGTAPVATSVGDIWVDTANKNEMKRWSGSAWVSYRDLSILDADAKAATAIANASTAQATADGKVASYFQTGMPTGQVAADIGDLWFDTDDGNKMWRYSGSAWVVADDQRIAATVTAAANAKTIADSKIVTLYQDTEPSATGRTTGDLWVDTNDDNKLWRWSGAVWQSARDLSIATAANSAAAALEAAQAAQTAADTAQAVADGSIRTFYQSLAPTGLNNTTNIGDLWFDTDDGQAYRWNGTIWSIIEDNSIAVALAAAQNAQTTADGKITSFYQPGQPATGEVGDLWFDTDDKNKPYYCSSIAPLTWSQVRDGTILDAQSTANTALTSANGKNVTYYQTAMPTGGTYILGDTWIDTDDSNKMWVYNGSTFVSAQDGAIGAASSLAASKGKVLIQSGAPAVADQLVQNLWIDTTNGLNTPKRWNTATSAWVTVTDKVATDAAAAVVVAQAKADQAFNNAATAATAAGTAQTTADGKNRVWYQTTAPTGISHRAGDLWFDTDDGNKPYVWVTPGDTWTSARDASIATAQAKADTAFTTATGKNTTYYQTTQPSGGTYTIGDMWVDTDGGYKLSTYNGSIWQTVQDALAAKAEAITAAAADATAKADQAELDAIAAAGAAAQVKIDQVWQSARSYINPTASVSGLTIKQGPAPTIVASPTAMGGDALQKSGSISGWWEDTNGKQAYDPTALYRFSVRVRVVSASTTAGSGFYFGLVGLAADKTTYVNGSGLDSYSSQQWVTQNAIVPATGAWVDYVVYYKGVSASTPSGAGTVLNPRTVHSATKFFMPGMILDYNNGNGVWEVSHWSVDVIDAAGHQAIVDAQTAKTDAIAAAAIDATNKANAAALLAINSTAYSTNPSFDDWSSTYPAGYGTWGSVVPTKETALIRRGPNSMRFNVTAAGTQAGVTFATLGHAPNIEYMTVELEFYLVSGTISGAGFLLDWAGMTNNRATVDLDFDIPVATVGKWYRVSKTVRRPTNATGTFTGFNGFLMANYTATGAAAKDIIFDWMNVRPATVDEITAYGAPAAIAVAKSEAISSASTDATTKANAAQAAAIAAAATDASTKANAAKTEAITAAATDAQTKADAAEADAIAAAALTAQAKADAAQSAATAAAATDAQTKADAAEADAIAAAAITAQLKADGAQQAAIDAAAITAQQKADAAKAAAEAAAALTAQAKADAAQAAAIAAAATDATNKANAAQDAALIAAAKMNAFSNNASFEEWTGTLPNNYGVFTTGPTKETAIVLTGKTAARWNLADTTTQAGLTFNAGITSHLPNLEYYTVELEFYLVSGGLGGAGMILDWNGLTPARSQINLATEFPSIQTGKWYRLTKVLRRPVGATGTWSSMGGYLMANWSGHGAGAVKNLIYDWMNIRPSTTEEITAYGQPAALTAAVATKNATYYETAKPTGGTYKKGDIWFDTDDGNKIYVHNGTDFVVSQDAAMFTVQPAVSTAITNSANGKNKVVYSTSDASGTGYIAGDTWFKTDGAPGNIIGQWEFTTSWQVRKVAETVLGTLSAGKITTGVFDANRIGANTITASKIFVGDLTNLAADGKFSDTTKANWLGSGTVTVSAGNPNTLRVVTAASGNNDQPNSNLIQVTAGEQIYGEVWVYGEPSNVGGGGPNMHLTLSDNNNVSSWPGFGNVTRAACSGVWTKISGKITIPANIKTAKVELSVSFSADAVGNVYHFREVSVRRMATGNLIVDGAIQAGSAIIADAAIGNAKIADLNASKLTAGTIAAARLDAESIKAKIIEASYLQATDIFAPNSITSASGIFGTMDASVINAGTIGADRIDANTVRAKIIAATDIAAADIIATGSITTASGVFGDISATSITSGEIAAARLNAETIKARLIDASLINAEDILASNSITATNGIIGSIDAAKITVGALSAARIAAKSIGVDKLVISSTDNLIVEADFSNSGTSWQLGPNNTINATAGRGTLPAMQFTGSVATTTSLNLVNKIPVGSEDRFRGSMWLKSSASAPSGQFKLMGRCYTTATAYTDITISSNSTMASANVWTNISGISPVLPAGTIAMEFYLSVTNGATGTLTDIDYVGVTRAADGALVVDGSITATKLETDLVLATKIIAGDPSGTHAAMEPTGFRVYAADPSDGIPNEVVRLGVAATDDYFAITKADGSLAASISQDGKISSDQVNANASMYYKGNELQTLLDSMARGPLYKAELSGNRIDGITTKYGLVEASFIVKGDRQIQLDCGVYTYPSFVDPTEVYLEIRYTDDGTAPTVNSPLLINVPMGEVSKTYLDTKSFTHTIRPYTFLTNAEGKTVRLLLCVLKGGGNSLKVMPGASTYMYVTDVGRGIPHTPNHNNGGGSLAAPPPTTAAVTTYVKQYGSIDSASYKGDNTWYGFDTARMYQGLSPAGYGNLKSIAVFNNMTADLSGSNINYIRVYFNFSHWYNNAGGTARIGLHGFTGVPATFSSNGVVATSGGWPKPGARWVDIPSAHFANFKSGTYRGVSLEGDGTYGTYGIADRPVIEISYTK